MAKVHYVVRRSRMGRFNFTLISGTGRITGSVVVPTAGRTGADIERDAREQIRHIAETFVGVVSPGSPGADTASRFYGETVSHSCGMTTL